MSRRVGKTAEELEEMNADELCEYLEELARRGLILNEDEMRAYREMEGPLVFICNRWIEIGGETYEIYVHKLQEGTPPDEANTRIVVARAPADRTG